MSKLFFYDKIDSIVFKFKNLKIVKQEKCFTHEIYPNVLFLMARLSFLYLFNMY